MINFPKPRAITAWAIQHNGAILPGFLFGTRKQATSDIDAWGDRALHKPIKVRVVPFTRPELANHLVRE